MNITLLVSGSIAAFKACSLTSLLIKAGHQVQPVLTPAAGHFIGGISLEALSGRQVLTDLFAARSSMEHIELRRWSDLFLFYPATANRINQLAAGLAPDLVGALFLANNGEKPFWIAPAMNSAMLAHPATQSSLSRLAAWGCRILPSAEGRLACGDTGQGKLLAPEAVLEMVEEVFQGDSNASDSPQAAEAPEPDSSAEQNHPPIPPRGRVLVTGGAMSQPVDAVRSLVNTSTGRTAAAITRELTARGWQVDFLHYHQAEVASGSWQRSFPYTDYQDFAGQIHALLAQNSYQWIIHAAAVADYQVQAAHPGKLESGGAISLTLVPTEKILPTLKSLAAEHHPGDPPPGVVGFKLTTGEGPAGGAARAGSMMAAGQVDYVVWNDLSTIRGQQHEYAVFDPAGAGSNPPQPCHRGSSKDQLARDVARALESPRENLESSPKPDLVSQRSSK